MGPSLFVFISQKALGRLISGLDQLWWRQNSTTVEWRGVESESELMVDGGDNKLGTYVLTLPSASERQVYQVWGNL